MILNKIFLVVLSFASTFFLTSFKSNINDTISDFSLLNTNNKYVSTLDYKKAKGFIVIFTCNHCPFAKLYTKRLNDLHKKYLKLNVPVLAINAMDYLIYEDESFEMMKARAKKDKFSFPYLHDKNQEVAKQFGAEHTPTAFIIWKEDAKWRIKYSGSIDDNGENPSIAVSFISKAVDELLHNKSVTEPVTESFGCRIFYREK